MNRDWLRSKLQTVYSQANVTVDDVQKTIETLRKQTEEDSCYNEEYVRKTFAEIAPTEEEIQQSIEKANGAENFTVMKSAVDKQLVFGWANWSMDAEGNIPFDWQGDIKSPEVLEDAAYQYVLHHRIANEKHEKNAQIRGVLIESMMFTEDKIKALGVPAGILPVGWWVGFYIPDPEVFDKIKSGEYKMFSIEGSSKRVPLSDIEVGD